MKRRDLMESVLGYGGGLLAIVVVGWLLWPHPEVFGAFVACVFALALVIALDTWAVSHATRRELAREVEDSAEAEGVRRHVLRQYRDRFTAEELSAKHRAGVRFQQSLHERKPE